MNSEFTTMGIIFMATAWIAVIGLTIFSVGKILKKKQDQ
jgi:hypothetical protein